MFQIIPPPLNLKFGVLIKADKEVQKGAEEINKYKDLHIMLTMGPMARRKDYNFPTQEASTTYRYRLHTPNYKFALCNWLPAVFLSAYPRFPRCHRGPCPGNHSRSLHCPQYYGV